MLGIASYTPNFFSDSTHFFNTLEGEFTTLIGKSIQRYWLMWDEIEGEWFPDGPVIVQINDKKYEFCAYQIGEFSCTVNAIEMREKLLWYVDEDEEDDQFKLYWKENAMPNMNKLLNRPITQVGILKYHLANTTLGSSKAPFTIAQEDESGYILFGLEFIVEKSDPQDEKNHFMIYNALDENGLSDQDLQVENLIERMYIGI